MFSKACEYGIRATIYIAGQSGQGLRASLQDIAREVGSPAAFTAKILQTLTRNKIISANKGPNGGYEFHGKDAGSVKLAQLVKAIDGKKIYKDCCLGLAECDSDRPCPIHHKFEHIREELEEMLENTTISELAEKLGKGEVFLKRT
jgi:Rrf2 family iron-sulfur cluster assembly transcriptional regulator